MLISAVLTVALINGPDENKWVLFLVGFLALGSIFGGMSMMDDTSAPLYARAPLRSTRPIANMRY
ncbi:MAG: hypothetical protein CMM25_07190 [Rhodospirillaceae bacterium]|nr:hypothetical protein [Rhodospirillaceae bacterium]